MLKKNGILKFIDSTEVSLMLCGGSEVCQVSLVMVSFAFEKKYANKLNYTKKSNLHDMAGRVGILGRLLTFPKHILSFQNSPLQKKTSFIL